ncbi:unnamed protein product [Gongylonema pulchrum]|uniref:VPS9 domain-containing protein n=1 Tax=Gongylonema pulchrum TaxID=637853 RepID=A0A183DN94_9BILA|nr:unnamed protein product [Gongylonema pulchrum]
MYENVVSVLVRFHKVHMERSNVKEEDVLRLVSISGQLMAWIDNDKQRLKDLLEYFRMGGRDPVINKLSHKLSSEIAAFREKLSVKEGGGDVSLAKGRSEARRINRRFVARCVEMSNKDGKNGNTQLGIEVPSFGTSPNEFVTAAGVALLSLAHQLSAYAQDTHMATAIASAAKLETVGWYIRRAVNEKISSTLAIQEDGSRSGGDLEADPGPSSIHSARLDDTDFAAIVQLDEAMMLVVEPVMVLVAVKDIPSWWIGKCAVALQECFVDKVGDISKLPAPLCRQLSVDYAYLADVFEDLGTTKISDFVIMRQSFVDSGYFESSQ